MTYELPKKMKPVEMEARWQAFWESESVFKFRLDSERPIYSIDTPPPTISGQIHMGHVFSYVQAEIIARFWRMKGYNVFYPFGFDGNGLPTERLVEKDREVRAQDMDRASFVKLCLESTGQYEAQFKEFWSRLGFSVDWELEYSTIDERCRRISQRSFLRLYEAGEAYRKEAPSLWCTECQTSIAQAETESQELPSKFHDVTFKLPDGSPAVIATTRPELLPACVAIFFHPSDKRYKALEGEEAITPLFEQAVKILPSELADPEKGTGLVMCCTFGDTIDIQWWKEHDLPLRVAIGPDGRMNELAGSFQGLTIAQAREAIAKALDENGMLGPTKEIAHPVQCHERCGKPLEFLVTRQWFIRVMDKKDALIAQADKINWYPAFMKARYVHWVENLNWDWCITRQRYYGVPFPLWYCKGCGETNVVHREQDLPVDPLASLPSRPCIKCDGTEFEPDRDVLDTWATSALTPQINYRWGEPSDMSSSLSPMSLRPQAHDIIRTWAFYTIAASYMHGGQIPWRDVMISGHALDQKGKKMSKKLGNIIAPQEILAAYTDVKPKLRKDEDGKKYRDKYAADVVRYWAAKSKLGNDVSFSDKIHQIGKRLTVKIWNASKFALMHLGDYTPGGEAPEYELFDRWLLSNLHGLIGQVTRGLESYEYSAALIQTEEFFWGHLCDNYLEIVKDRLYNPEGRGEAARYAAQATLYESLLVLLKLFAPVMPHLTEEIYQAGFRPHEGERSIHLTSWPRPDARWTDDEAARDAGALGVSVVTAVRKFKSERSLSLKTRLAQLTVSGDDTMRAAIDSARADLAATAQADELLTVAEAGEDFIETDVEGLKLGIVLAEVEQ